MEEMDSLRAAKLAELQKSQQTEQQEFAEKFAQLESLVKPHMSAEALSRYGNLRVAHPQLCIQAMVYLAKMIQSGKMSQVDDRTFKLTLMRLQEGKKDYKIHR